MNDLPPSETKHSANKSGIVILFVVVLFLLLGSMIGLYFFNKTHEQSLSVALPSQTISPPVSVTSTPAASISASLTPTAASLSAVSVRVLNGSGISGSAQGVISSLRSAGFTRLTIGNATTFNYRGITIQMTQDGSRYLPQVRAAINKSEPTAAITTTVTEEIPGDIQVIVGR